MAIAGTILG